MVVPRSEVRSGIVGLGAVGFIINCSLQGSLYCNDTGSSHPEHPGSGDAQDEGAQGGFPTSRCFDSGDQFEAEGNVSASTAGAPCALVSFHTDKYGETFLSKPLSLLKERFAFTVNHITTRLSAKKLTTHGAFYSHEQQP
jgi:hypothetical protein